MDASTNSRCRTVWAKWQTEPYQNLTFSILFIPKKLLLQQAFLLNMSVAIAVVRAVEDVLIEHSLTEELYIKWPNDILINNKKSRRDTDRKCITRATNS